jgi:hypothetical protein
LRILRSHRCRYALALLLLTFAAWVALFCWTLPYQRNLLPEINADAVDGLKNTHQYPVDISPNGDTIFLDCRGSRGGADEHWREYWDTRSGIRVEKEQSEHLKQYCSCCDEPNPYRWHTALGESFVQALRSDNQLLAPEDFCGIGRSPANIFFSENGRYLALPIPDDLNPPRAQVIFPTIQYSLTDLIGGKRIAQLQGCNWPAKSLMQISPNGSTLAIMRMSFYEHSRDFKESLILSNLQDNSAKTLVAEADNFDYIRPLFYSSDGQYVFARMHKRFDNKDRDTWIWWNIDGRKIAEVHEKPKFHSEVPATYEALVDCDRILVITDSEDELGSCRTWDVATGRQLGEWRVPQNSSLRHIGRQLVAGSNGRYIALRCMGGLEKSMWDKWSFTARIRRLLLGSPHGAAFLVVLDAVDLQEVGRVPGDHALISQDGRILVATEDAHETVSVYDLPLRKLWSRISSYAVGATLACALLFATCRRFLRRRQAPSGLPR